MDQHHFASNGGQHYFWTSKFAGALSIFLDLHLSVKAIGGRCAPSLGHRVTENACTRFRWHTTVAAWYTCTFLFPEDFLDALVMYTRHKN